MSGRERDIYIYMYIHSGIYYDIVDIMIQHDTTYPIDCDVRHIWTMMKTSSTTLKQCFPGLCLCEVYVADQKITRSIGSDVQLSLHDLQYVAIKCLKAMGNNIHMQSQESKRILMIPVCWCTWECVLSGKLHLLLLNLDWSIFVTIFRSPRASLQTLQWQKQRHDGESVATAMVFMPLLHTISHHFTSASWSININITESYLSSTPA